jgi:hypothetical protein
MGSKIVRTGQIRAVPTSRFLGRTTAGTGAAEELTVAQSKSLLGLTTQILLVGTSDAAELDITPFGSQTVNQQVWRTLAGVVASSIDASGRPIFTSGSFSVTSTFNATMWNGGQIGWTSSGSATGTSTFETGFARDGAGLIAARVGTTAHDLRIYNTYTNSSNYERGHIGWQTNVFTIGSYALGTGTLRSIALGVTGNSIGLFGATPIARPTTAIASATHGSSVGTAVTIADTFDGYTLLQVVKALRNLGVLT